MIVTYSLQVISCYVELHKLPRELRNTDMVMVYRVHKTNMELTHDDIVTQREVTYLLEIPPAEVIEEKVILEISAYKYHRRGAKILLGSTKFEIQDIIKLALRTESDVIGIPGNYILNNGDFSAVSMCSSIQVMIADRSEVEPYIYYNQRKSGHEGGSGDCTKSASVKKEDGKGKIEENYRS